MTTGENIPTTREAPGNVPQGSLAAESARKGGAFASNPGQGQGQGEQGPQKRSQQPQSSGQQQKQQQQHAQGGGSTTAPSKTTSLHLENQQSSRGTAASTGTGTGTGQGQQRQQGAVLGVRGANPPQETARQTTNLEGQGGPAPSYAAVQQGLRDPAGPHGKNLKEGGFEGSGTEAGPLPEPGSEQDPTRVATSEMRGGLRMGAGGKEGAGEGQGKSWYTPLGGDEPA